jgi:hypothetical protein
MSKIAKHYLAIQGSAVPSERAFSSSGIRATARRNALLPETFGALQVLKSGYRQGRHDSGRARRSSCLLSDCFRLVCYLVQYSCDFSEIKMASSVVRTGSEPEPDPMEPNPVVRFQVRPTPPNLTPVQFGVLSFQSKNRTEPDYGNTNLSQILKYWANLEQFFAYPGKFWA